MFRLALIVTLACSAAAVNPCETTTATVPTTVTTTPAATVTTTPAGPGPCDPTTPAETTTVTTTPAVTATTTPVVTTPGPCDVATTPAATVTTTPAGTVTTTPAPTTTVTAGPCETAAVKLYSDKQQKSVQEKTGSMAQTTAVLSASALPSWLLPMCGVFALAAGVSVMGMRRRRAARSTRTVQVPSGQLANDSGSDEEPFLSSDLA